MNPEELAAAEKRRLEEEAARKRDELAGEIHELLLEESDLDAWSDRDT